MFTKLYFNTRISNIQQGISNDEVSWSAYPSKFIIPCSILEIKFKPHFV